MRFRHPSISSTINSFAFERSFSTSQNRYSRKLLCLALVLSLLVLPNPELAKQIPLYAGSAIDFIASSAERLSSSITSLFKPTSTPRESFSGRIKDTLFDRANRVARIRVSPSKLVGYQDERVTFSALAIDSLDRTLQGVAFEWQSSNPSTVVIDGSGRASLLQPGLATITCRAGSAQASARILVKPGHRPAQTDEEWKRDQAGLSDSTVGNNDRSNTGQSLLAALLDDQAPAHSDYSVADSIYRSNRLARAAAPARSLSVKPAMLRRATKASAIRAAAPLPQSGYSAEDSAYDELWSEPRNLTGSPRNRAIEPTKIGAVMPEGSNINLAAPIVSLPGRGVGVNLALYYNSRVWGRRANTVTFDPVASWPSPGFSLGFGRIIPYDPQYNYGTLYRTKYMLVDPDGTRHYLGQSAAGDYMGGISGETTDGYHIKFSGYWNSFQVWQSDGTCIYYSRINNRLLPNWIQDTNGNYITITYKDLSEGYACTAIDYITDSLGRVIQFNYDTQAPVPQLVSITAPGLGGTAQNPVTQTVAEFQYESRSVSTSFSGLTVQNGYAYYSALRRVIFPATGTGYVFSYSAYGMVYNYSIRAGMSGSDGTETAAVSFNYPTVASSLTDVPSFTQRTETAVDSPTSVYTYARYFNTNDATFVITQPDTTQLVLSRYTATASVGNGLVSASKVRLSDGVTERASTLFTYANDGGGSPQVQSAISTVTNEDATSVQTKVDFQYDAYGNITNKREYGTQVSGQWQARRRTRWVYKTDSAYISANVKDASLKSMSMTRSKTPTTQTT